MLQPLFLLPLLFFSPFHSPYLSRFLSFQVFFHKPFLFSLLLSLWTITTSNNNSIRTRPPRPPPRHRPLPTTAPPACHRHLAKSPFMVKAATTWARAAAAIALRLSSRHALRPRVGLTWRTTWSFVPRLCRRTTRRRSSSINTNNPTNCIIWTTMGFLSPRQRRRLRRCQRPLQQPRPRLSARALKLSTLPRASSSPARSGCEVLEALCICLPPRVFGPGSLSTQPYIHTYIFMHHPVPATPTTKMAALFYYTTTP